MREQLSKAFGKKNPGSELFPGIHATFRTKLADLGIGVAGLYSIYGSSYMNQETEAANPFSASPEYLGKLFRPEG
jgi:hypothetical protein